jgi:hypothetical protein
MQSFLLVPFRFMQEAKNALAGANVMQKTAPSEASFVLGDRKPGVDVMQRHP